MTTEICHTIIVSWCQWDTEAFSYILSCISRTGPVKGLPFGLPLAWTMRVISRNHSLSQRLRLYREWFITIICGSIVDTFALFLS